MKKRNAPHYDDDGQRLTDCCAAYSTYDDDGLRCKCCYAPMPFGQGDGSEYRSDAADTGSLLAGYRPATR